MNHMKLIKLMYLVDREALIRWGRPITFDWYFSLPHGPVLSFTLDLINSDREPDESSYWHGLISERDGHRVSLVTDELPVDQLSPAEESLLDELFGEFGAMDEWELRDYCHRLPEWQDPKGSRLAIQLEQILSGAGLGPTEVSEILEDLRAELSAEQQLA